MNQPSTEVEFRSINDNRGRDNEENHHHNRYNHMKDWEIQVLTTTIETDNQRYIEQIATAKSRRNNSKLMAITKIREETIVGVRLTKVLYLANIGNRLFHKTVIIAGLIPRKYKLLTNFEFYTNFNGTQFNLPRGDRFHYYEDAVECWTHNGILQDNHQLDILIKSNFNKFVKALLKLSKPTATIRSFDEHEVQTVSPYSSSTEEEDSEDDDDYNNDVSGDNDEDEDLSNTTTVRSSFDATQLKTVLPLSSSSGEEEFEDDEDLDDDEDDHGENASMKRSLDDIEAETVTLYWPSSEEEQSNSDDDDDDDNTDSLHQSTMSVERSFEGIEAETVTLCSPSCTEEEQSEDYDGHSDDAYNSNDATQAQTPSSSFSISRGEEYDDEDNDDDETDDDDFEQISLRCNVVSPRPSSFQKANEYDDDNYGERKSGERNDSGDNDDDVAKTDTDCIVSVSSTDSKNDNNGHDEVSTSDVGDEGFGCCGMKSKVGKVKKRKNIFMGWICSKILKVFVKSRVLL